MIKILIVDDVVTNRVLLRELLLVLDDGFSIVEAVDGNDAVEKFHNEKPDLILMDINMPGMNGYEATKIIKSNVKDDYLPVIFVTALKENSNLAPALESGGDDFISKPIILDILKSKIKAHLRIRELSSKLNSQNKLLVTHNNSLIYEHELIEHFFTNAMKKNYLDKNIIRYSMSSKSTFNGDVFLAERGPQGGVFIIMGDFTGHGLTAAMGTLPVAMTFFKSVSENNGVQDLATEINSQLYKLMPPSMFFVATIMELNKKGDVLNVWMGGMPECYWLNKKGELKGEIHSLHMPLGVLNDDEFDNTIQVFNIEKDDKVYLYSDGIVEAKNSQGELFGNERLKKILIQEQANRFDTVLNELHDFTSTNEQDDDITFVELACNVIPAKENSNDKHTFDKNALSWNVSIELKDDDFRCDDPVNNVSSIIGTMPHISSHRGILHVLLTEVFANALEHSILDLQSVLKTDNAGFDKFYEEKAKALLNLKDAYIRFEFHFLTEKENYYLEVKVTDNGKGFTNDDSKINDDYFYGRGLKIIREYVEKLSFSDDGKTVTFLYKLVK